jgi:hypothetical protein
MISVRGAHAAFDSLARHLVEMHSATLVALRMEHAFLNSDVVRQLCIRCNQIEELGISTTVDILVRTITSCPFECGYQARRLFTTLFRLGNVSSDFEVNDEAAISHVDDLQHQATEIVGVI